MLSGLQQGQIAENDYIYIIGKIYIIERTVIRERNIKFYMKFSLALNYNRFLIGLFKQVGANLELFSTNAKYYFYAILCYFFAFFAIIS